MPARDPVETHAGVASEAGHSAMRADIRRLGGMLGDTLVRQAGAEVLDLVERVRRLARQSSENGRPARPRRSSPSCSRDSRCRRAVPAGVLS